ncbi:MAG: hypothetical protein DRH21_06150, partial [Deltaproteobacteria bacterium]
PSDGSTCTACHSGTANPVEGWITSDIPATGYMPGETYSITATGSHEGVVKFGFEVTAEDNTDAKTGIFIVTNSTENKLTNGNNAITHQAGGTTPSGDMRTWTFDWTAPAESTGDVTFYGAFNATNGNGGTSGDVVYTSNYSVMEHAVGVNQIGQEDLEVSLYPNPFTDYIRISMKDDKKQVSSIQLFNQAGSMVKQISVASSSNEWRLDANDLNAGMYFVVLETTDNTKVSKSIIKL